MIEVKRLSKSYEDNVLFNDINLTIRDNEMVAIMGKSGSGKSTLLNIIGLMESYDDGEVCIDGVSILPNTKEATLMLRKNISYLFQNFALVDTMSVEDNLLIALEYQNIQKKEKTNVIKEALEVVGLSGYEKRKVYTLSGGQQQRVSLARTILKNSHIILCDEPTGSLDKENAEIVMNILKHLHKKGKTIVIVSHDEWIASQCERIIRL